MNWPHIFRTDSSRGWGVILLRKAAGHSIPASEHSTITSWGVNGEVDAMTNMLLSYPTGLVACVSRRKKNMHEPNKVTLKFRWYVSASNVFRLHHRMIFPFGLAILLMSSRHARTAKIRKNARFWWFDLLILIRWIGGWCGWWWNPLEGLLGRQVEGYDQRFTTQMMTPRGKGLHKWNSKSWTIKIIPSTSTATYKLEGSQVCERNLAKRQEVTWYQYHFVKTFFGDKNTTGRITGDSFGRLVVRPDSGDPADTCKVCRVNFLKKQRPKIEKFWKNYWSWWVFLCALKCHFLREIFCTL